MLSVFFCFVFVLVGSLIPEAQGQCRNLKFTSAHIHGYRLKNHVIRTIDVINEDICEWQCYLEPNCVSYNYKKKEEANGGHKCDLNNATYEHDNEHSGDLGKSKNYVYRGAENSCAKKPCKNNATCQAGFTDRDYQCLCIPGFTGHDCENDINECTDGTHKCDVKGAVCNNTRGSYNCTCKDGFLGDGLTCTDIDECANGSYNCDVNAVCSNTQGSYLCMCKDGFYGDGQNCTRFEISGIACASPLGMENGKIPDSAIVASSRYSQDLGPEHGRLKNKGGWVSYYKNAYQFLQIDLENVTKVTRIGTQGRSDAWWSWWTRRWTKTYTLDYSEDGGTFISYNSGQVLQGNKDHVNTEVRILDRPIIARFIKINVKTFQRYPSLRVELYGCTDGFPTPEPSVCLEALGMQNGEITDSAITASTEYYSAFNGRLHFLSGSGRVGGWVAGKIDENQFLQVNFGDWRKVSRVAIQGRQDADEWVKSFSISYGNDSVFFEDYKEDSVKKVFTGSTDRYTPVSHDLKNPIITRYIRIHPKTWRYFISMRAEFYGCSEGFKIPEIACASPLGMENGKIPDSAIVASSRLSEDLGPEQGRLNNKGGWVSYHDWDAFQFLQIDLGNVTKVTRIATQGQSDKRRWTKTYTLDYSEDGGTFIPYNNGQVLQGNTDNVQTEGRMLDPPIIARFIKINVKTFNWRPSLRVELYGCTDGISTPKPPVCLEALGMQNGQIPDYAISASTDYYSAFNGRLHFLSRSGRAGGWVAQWYDNSPFLQVNFGDWRKVTRVAIQGRQDADQWVKSFSLSYGYDSVFFKDYKEDGVNKIFQGNTDRYTPVSHDLKSPIITRYIRIHPKTWETRISMRAEFYGCREGKNAQFQLQIRFKWQPSCGLEIKNRFGAWVAKSSDVNPWLQIDLIGQYIVTRVATQGRNSSTYQQRVTKYKLQYGDDGTNFKYYQEQGQTTDKYSIDWLWN
ncbi:uncharacterized protein LOC144633566 [Oculina patagonica]